MELFRSRFDVYIYVEGFNSLFSLKLYQGLQIHKNNCSPVNIQDNEFIFFLRRFDQCTGLCETHQPTHCKGVLVSFEFGNINITQSQSEKHRASHLKNQSSTIVDIMLCSLYRNNNFSSEMESV